MLDLPAKILDLEGELAPAIQQVRTGDLASLPPIILSGHLALLAGNLPRVGWLCSEAYREWLEADATARNEKAKAYSTYRAQGLSSSAADKEADMFPGYLDSKLKEAMADARYHKAKLLREDLTELAQAIKVILKTQQEEMRLAGRGGLT